MNGNTLRMGVGVAVPQMRIAMLAGVRRRGLPNVTMISTTRRGQGVGIRTGATTTFLTKGPELFVNVVGVFLAATMMQRTTIITFAREDQTRVGGAGGNRMFDERGDLYTDGRTRVLMIMNRSRSAAPTVGAVVRTTRLRLSGGTRTGVVVPFI